MNVVVASNAGFCWGVRRAMDAALEASARYGHRGPVRTLGPLIHNPQALAHLTQRGIREAASIDELHHGAVIIRAHGIPKDEHHLLKTRHATGRLRLSNATCPEVAKVQAIVRRYSGKGYFTVILGSATHAEVLALRTFASNGYVVVADLAEAEAISEQMLSKVLVVAQTTFRIHDFHEIARYIKARGGNVVIKNTVCRDTWERQDEALEIASTVDAAVVVGGRSSNNTRHLVEVVQKAGKPVQLVESSEELDLKDLLRYETVGVLAGASTPTWTVDEVVEALHNAGTKGSFLLRAQRSALILQLPYPFVWAILAFLLHHALHWPTGWAGPTLPAAFTLGLCALMPYWDPLGLIAKGMVRGRFLKKYRWAFLSTGLAGLLLSMGAAARLGSRVVIGVVALIGIAALYHRNFHALGKSWNFRLLPASKDLGQALAPALLIIGLPWLQGYSIPFLNAFAAFLTCLALALAAHANRHVREFHEDRILGCETLPVAMGLKGTRILALVSTIAGLLMLVVLLWGSVR